MPTSLSARWSCRYSPNTRPAAKRERARRGLRRVLTMLGNSPFTWVVSDVNTGYRGSCIKASQGMVITGIAKQSTFSFAVLDILDVLKERYDIVAPITDRLVSYCLENALLVSLEDPKTIEDLRKELDFPITGSTTNSASSRRVARLLSTGVVGSTRISGSNRVITDSVPRLYSASCSSVYGLGGDRRLPCCGARPRTERVRP